MKIYKSEVEAGIADNIKANASIAYCQPVTKLVLTDYHKELFSAAAAETSLAFDLDDLYTTNSILVSTVWNLNDDVFVPEEVWVARHTPIHKPDNMDHIERDIVGHMVDCYCIDTDGKIISADTPVDDLPELFHIVNSAVIYRSWQDSDYRERVHKLIADIEDGKKFVSMECRFRGFDYALLSKGTTDVKHVIARNESTAFLSKYLRAYGGPGQYEGYQVGRILRNISFVGKGYVDRPANPSSIIFTKDKGFSFTTKNGGNILNDGVYLLQMPKASISTSIKERNEMNELETKNAELSSKVDTLTAEVADLKAKVEKYEKENKELSEAKATVDAELAKVRAEEKKAKRVAKLVEGGVSKEVAEQKVNTFENLTDEQFDSVANDVIEAAKKSKEADDMKKKMECSKSEEELKKEAEAAAKAEEEAKKQAAAKALEAAQLEGGVIVPQSGVTEDDMAKTRASLAEFFENVLARGAKKKKATK